MKPIVFTINPTVAADDDGICESQSVSGGGTQELTLNGALVSGGEADLDVPREVSITSTGDDSGITFHVYGRNYRGDDILESLTGPNTNTVTTDMLFSVVTKIEVTGNTTGSITVGTNSVVGTEWIPLSLYEKWPVGIHVEQSGSGSATWDIETTGERIMVSYGPFSHTVHGTLTGQSATASGSLDDPATAVRLVTTALTVPQTLTLRVAQARDSRS